MNAPLDLFGDRLDEPTLIEASAGTGKTWAICGLVLRLLLERGLDISRILVVTFTAAATAELRERIRARIAQVRARLAGGVAAGDDPFVDRLLESLRERAGLDDRLIAQRLEAALQGFDEASIFTIHGFCRRALADAPFATGVPMVQALVEDMGELRRAAVNDVWRREVAGKPMAPALAAHLLARGDEPASWDKLVARALARPLAQVHWPPGLDDEPPPDFTRWQAAHDQARTTWRRERDDILALVEAARPRLNASSYKPATIAQAADDWDRLLAPDEPWAASGKFDKLELLTTEKLKPKKNAAPVPPHPFFAQAAELLRLQAEADVALGRRRLRLLKRLLEEAPARLLATQRERQLVGFDDMLLALHRRLTGADGPALAATLRERFGAALVDEFQDTDPLQFAIFRALAGGIGADARMPVFFVGDPKQAIYSFRHADLHAYLNARAEVATRRSLADNQRAGEALLAALNALFQAHPKAFVLDGLDYEAVRFGAKKRPSWEDRGPARAALQLWALPDDAAGAPLAKRDAVQAAVSACAGEIARLVAAGRRGEVRHGGRNLAGGDIAVLVRSHHHGRLMRDALAALGVATVELSRASVFDSADARALELVLRAVLEPTKERTLRAALATELLGADAAAIDALGGDEAKTQATVERFAGYRQRWHDSGIAVALRALLAGEGVAARLLARADGERRTTNWLHLAERLQQAEADHPSPEALLRWLRAQRGATDAADAAQLRLESDRHLVQIVTVHRAKGLEYPVVFCPLLFDGRPARLDATDGLEYHDAGGAPVIDFRGGDLAPLKARMRVEAFAEDLRLIYVALTRAVQRCVLVVGPYRSRRSTKECGAAALNWLVAGDDTPVEQWLAGALPATSIRAAWARLADGRGPAVSLDPLPTAPGVPVAAEHVAPESIAALAPPSSIPPPWRIGSFSSLIQGARHEAAAIDHDARAAGDGAAEREGEADRDEADVLAGLDADDILRFPRGAEAGSCLHAAFERVDFGDPSGWPAAIEEALRLSPPAAGAGSDAPRHARMLERALHDVLHTPLPGGFALASVPRTRRLVELQFHLPAPNLDAGALGALLRRFGIEVPAWTFGALHGWLQGYIDLVVEHEGRYTLIDWKSNFLGTRAADYGGGALARAMAANGYALQYLLYTVALHRLLGRRVRGYDYERHFGGVAYLFVRGMRPGWLDADGRPAGVYATRPPLALVRSLSALLDGEGPR